MWRYLLSLGILVATQVDADGVPERVELTPELAAELGFGVEDIGSSPRTHRELRITFPLSDPHGCHPGRVQTFLLDHSGTQLSESSFDYVVTGPSAELLIGYEPATNDMAVFLQYCCVGQGCEFAYSISSISEFL